MGVFVISEFCQNAEIITRNINRTYIETTVDTAEKDITVKASNGATGWKFYAQTGVLIANDGAHDSE